LARLVPLLGLMAGAKAVVAVILAPTWLIEQLVIETRLGDYMPAARPPLGMNARIALSLTCGILSTGCTWLALQWIFVPQPMAGPVKPMMRALHIEDEPLTILKEKQKSKTSGWMGLLRRRQSAPSQDTRFEQRKVREMRRRSPILSAHELGPRLDDIDPQALHIWSSPPHVVPAFEPVAVDPIAAGRDAPVLDLEPTMLLRDVAPVFAPPARSLMKNPIRAESFVATIKEEPAATMPPRGDVLHIPSVDLTFVTMSLDELIAGLEQRLMGENMLNGPNFSPPISADLPMAMAGQHGRPCDAFDAVAYRRTAAAR
jgi:hypothetical protein